MDESNKYPEVFKSIETTDLTCAMSKDIQVNLSSFAKEINYVVFPNDIVFGTIHILKVSGNYVCLVDDHNQILLFNLEGDYLRSFGLKGKGPGEFIDVLSIDISSEQDLLVIREKQGLKVLKYKLSSGSLWGEDIKQSYIGNVNILPDGNILSYLPSPLYYENLHSIVIWKQDNSLYGEFYKRKSLKENPLESAKGVMHFYTYPSIDGGIDIFDARSFGIVNFKNDIVRPIFKYDFEDNIDVGLWSLSDQNYLGTTIMVRKCINLGCVYYIEANTYLKDIVYGIYDKCTGECGKIGSFFSGGGFIDDINGGPPFQPKMIAAAGIAYDLISKNQYEILIINKSEQNKSSLESGNGQDAQEVLRLVYF